MKLKLVSYTIAGLLLVGAVAALAPTAAAQAPTEAPSTTQIKITPPDKPIKPLSGVAVLQAQVDYSYFAAGSTALTATQVDLKVAEQPPWATVSISPSTLFFDIAGGAPTGGNTVQATPQKVSILVATTADAPAFTPANVRITATAKPNQPISGSSASDATLITADFFSIIDAQATQPIRVVRPQTAVDVPVTVSNFGNANSKITWSFASEPNGGLKVPIPQPVTLQAQQTGGTQTKATPALSIQTPFKNGYMNEPGIVNMNLKASYALDSGLEGDSVPVSILITTKGFYVPGFGPMTFLVALGAALGIAGKVGVLGGRKQS